MRFVRDEVQKQKQDRDKYEDKEEYVNVVMKNIEPEQEQVTNRLDEFVFRELTDDEKKDVQDTLNQIVLEGLQTRHWK